MSREVELIIRAKDEASKFVDSITDSLKSLTNAQGDVGQSAQKTGSLLEKLGKEFKDLNAEAKRLSSLGKIAEGLDRSATAVKNLGDSASSSASEFAEFSRESVKASNSLEKLRNALETEQNSLKANTAARRDASKELTAANRAVSAAERNQERYNAALAKTPKPQPGIRSAGVFVSADLESSRTSQTRLSQEVAQYTADIERSRKAIETLKPQVQAVSSQQGKLADQTDKASGSLSKNLETLERARGAYSGVQQSAAQASAALGGLVVTQDNVAQASARVAAELARTRAQIDGLSKAPRAASGATSDITSDTKDSAARRVAIERLRELRKEMANAQADAQRLNAAFRATAAPTEAMGTAAGQSQIRVRDLKTELVDLTSRLRSSQSGFQQWSQAAGQIRSATAGASAAANGLASASNAATAGIRPLGSAANGTAQGFNAASNAGNGFRSVLGGIYGDSRKSLSLMQRMRGEVLALAAAYVGLQAAISNIGGVVNAFQTLEAGQSRLGAVFNQDTGRVTQELQFLQRQADRLGIQFGVLADQYGKFAVAANTANFTVAETRKVFLSVAEAARVNKLSQDQLEGVFKALEQMISKGKVSAEELRGQLGDRMTGAFQIFATAIGVSADKLDEMMKKGEVLANTSNLLKFADELDRRFGSQLSASLAGTTAEIGRFSNNIFEAQLLVGQGGFIEAFTNSLRTLNEYFRSREGRDFFLSLGSALGTFTTALSKVPPYFDEIATGLQIFGAVKVAGFILNTTAALNAMRTSAIGLTASLTMIGPPTQQMLQNQSALSRALAIGVGQLGSWQSSLARAGTGLRVVGGVLGGLRSVVITMTGLFRGLWAAIGGLPGLILTGVTVALGQWVTSIDSATSSLDEHQRQMQAVVAAYEEAKGKAVDWGKAVKGVTISQAEDNLSKLLDSYREKFDGVKSSADAVKTLLTSFSGTAGELFRQGVSDADIKNMERYVAAIEEAGKTRDLEKLRTVLDDIARTTKIPALKEAAVDLQNLLDTASDDGKTLVDLSAAIDESAKKLALMKGEITETDAGLDKLSGAAETAKEKTSELGTNAKKINEAFGEMGKLISKTSEELKRLESIDGLNKQYQDAVKLARTMGQVLGLTDQYNKAMSGAIDGSFTGGSGLVDRIVGAESGGDAGAKNPNSSATGLGQFIESTWLKMFKQYFPDRAAGLTDAMILELRKNATVSREMVALYVQENAKILQQAGVAITDANLYLAHFLGPGGATKLLSAPKGTKVSDVLGADQVSANQSILGGGKSVEDVVAWAQRKVGISQEEVAIQRELAEIDQKRATKGAEYNSELENRLSLQENENANAGRLTEEAFVQKRLAEERKKAKDAEQVLDAQTEERIKRIAAEEYRVNEAKRDGKATTQEANLALQQAIALNQQRNALQQQFNAAQKAGDITTATSVQTQLTDVNAKLQEAIDKAYSMWQAIGGPAADVALTKLDTLKVKADASANSMSFLGLSTQQVGQLAGSFADGLVGVFDTFSESIANGENAMQALGKAFLQFAADFLRQIAQMILKQIILNALQSMGIPGLGAAHTGGLVGNAGVGSGNSRRGAAIGASFIRYHTGGVAGLAPNEVPTVLEENEEVLTEEDPRHRFNRGGTKEAGGSGAQSLKQILVLDPKDLANAMASSAGQEVFITFIKNNRQTVRQLIG